MNFKCCGRAHVGGCVDELLADHQDDAEPSDVACDPDWVLHISEIRVAWRLLLAPPRPPGTGSCRASSVLLGPPLPPPTSAGSGQPQALCLGQPSASWPAFLSGEQPSALAGPERASGREGGRGLSVSAFSPSVPQAVTALTCLFCLCIHRKSKVPQ